MNHRPTSRRLPFFALLALLVALALPELAFAQLSRTFRWEAPTTNADGSTPVDLTGYELAWGTSSSSFPNVKNIGNLLTGSITFPSNGTYFVIARAYDAAGNRSAASNVVQLTVGTNAVDSDGDGISDANETSLGTNPNNADSDNDGVNDGQEVVDHTNPLDRGSAMPVLGTRVCAEWNGFLKPIANVYEHGNLSGQNLSVTTNILDSTGIIQGTLQFAIAAGAQFDLLVHDMSGRRENSYGLVCSQHNGQAGDLDGRMVYYKGYPSGVGHDGEFEFAFAMGLSPGKKGSQFVPFNTYQPGLNLADKRNPVANWIQLTNLGQTPGTGELIYYDQAGAVLARDPIALAAGARGDFSGHRFGPNLVGTIEWRPSNSSIPYLMRNVRYVYDNARGVESFDTAFQLEGMHGSGEEQLVPLDTIGRTAVLELMNTLGEAVDVDVIVSGGSGASFRISLPAYGSYHYIADSVLGRNTSGYAIIKGSKPNSIAAVAMEYTYRADLGVAYMYGIPAKQALGSVLHGSLNTFLKQVSWLILVSPTAQNVTVSTVNGAGQAGPVRTFQVSGVRAVNLNEFANPDEYGVVTVQPERTGSLVAWVLRARGNEYVIPTPVR